MRSFLSVTIIMVQYCKFSLVPLKKYMYKARGWRVTLLWQCFFPEIQKSIFLQNEFKTWTRFWFEWNLYLFKLGRYSHYVTFKIFYLHLWFLKKKNFVNPMRGIFPWFRNFSFSVTSFPLLADQNGLDFNCFWKLFSLNVIFLDWKELYTFYVSGANLC